MYTAVNRLSRFLQCHIGKMYIYAGSETYWFELYSICCHHYGRKIREVCFVQSMSILMMGVALVMKHVIVTGTPIQKR